MRFVIVELLLQYVETSNTTQLLSLQGRTGLMLAALRGRDNIIDILLAAKTNFE